MKMPRIAWKWNSAEFLQPRVLLKRSLWLVALALAVIVANRAQQDARVFERRCFDELQELQTTIPAVRDQIASALKSQSAKDGVCKILTEIKKHTQ